ncbi:MAG: DNA-binding protein [Clostridia bacterium]|jgi:excisionase family DNA binding protein|nr:DNA-binding protein [Clostridia bacterium]NLJ31173.1 helix-turn-helix domain-containing protein [Clostridiales bacterium]
MNCKKSKANNTVLEKKVYTIPEIMGILNITRRAAYILVHSEQFRIVKIGNGIRIPKNRFDYWLKKNGGKFNE